MKKVLFWNVIALAVITLPFINACGSDDDDDNVDTTPISIFSDGEKSIPGADIITSSNEFVAYAEGNKVIAFHVGETSLLVNGKHTISIQVKPLYDLYDGPICDWGCDMDHIRHKQWQGTPSSKSTNETLVYENAGGASYLVYMFKNGMLSSIGTIVSTQHTKTFAKYLAERYLMLTDYEGEKTFFYGVDALELEKANTILRVEITNSSYFTTIYMPASLAKSRLTRSIESHEKYMEYVNEIFNIISEK